MQQAKWGTHGDHPVIALIPNSVEEMFTETVRAFNLAEYFRTPVIVLGDEIIGHMREKIRIPEPGELQVINRTRPKHAAPENDVVATPYETLGNNPATLPKFGKSRIHVTGLNHDRTGFPTGDAQIVGNANARIISKIYEQRDVVDNFQLFEMEDAEIMVLSVGSAARAAEEAVIELREQGIKAGLFRPITLWPFPKAEFRKYAKKAQWVIVPEMNLGQLKVVAERFVKLEKVVPINLVNGEPLNPEVIISTIQKLV